MLPAAALFLDLPDTVLDAAFDFFVYRAASRKQGMLRCLYAAKSDVRDSRELLAYISVRPKA